MLVGVLEEKNNLNNKEKKKAEMNIMAHGWHRIDIYITKVSCRYLFYKHFKFGSAIRRRQPVVSSHPLISTLLSPYHV